MLTKEEQKLLHDSCIGNKGESVLHPYDVISREDARAFLEDKD